MYQLRTLRIELKRDFKKVDKKKIEKLVIWINNRIGYTAWTKADARGWLKRFYRWLKLGTSESEYPDEVIWIKTHVKLNETTQPDVLNGDEVEANDFKDGKTKGSTGQFLIILQGALDDRNLRLFEINHC
jgi:site-specific recombinase XerD